MRVASRRNTQRSWMSLGIAATPAFGELANGPVWRSLRHYLFFTPRLIARLIATTCAICSRGLRRIAKVALPTLAVAGCSACNPKPWYAIPDQQQSFDRFEGRPARVVAMDDADTDRRIVRDIERSGGTSWRWAMQRPAIKLRVRSDRNLKYMMDFTLPEITFKDTGPVTISFFVNSHLLERVRYSEQGSKHFEKSVPRDWVTPGEENEVGAEIDKMWTGADGKRFGFIISRMGLTE